MHYSFLSNLRVLEHVSFGCSPVNNCSTYWILMSHAIFYTCYLHLSSWIWGVLFKSSCNFLIVCIYECERVFCSDFHVRHIYIRCDINWLKVLIWFDFLIWCLLFEIFAVSIDEELVNQPKECVISLLSIA
jgi:hypothetical protein